MMPSLMYFSAHNNIDQFLGQSACLRSRLGTPNMFAFICPTLRLLPEIKDARRQHAEV